MTGQTRLYVLLAVTFFAAWSAQARADECPITIEDARLVANGSPRHFVRYQIAIHANTADPYALRLQVAGTTADATHTVYVPVVYVRGGNTGFYANATLSFTWPQASLTSVTVKDAIKLTDGSFTHCTADIVAIAEGSDKLKSSFDDSKSTWPREEIASVVVDAIMLQRVPPDYPEAAIEDGFQGTVIISVTIGEDGKIASARVYQSSGSLALNQAALDAIQRSIFAPAMFDGKPTSGTYLVEYDFRLH